MSSRHRPRPSPTWAGHSAGGFIVWRRARCHARRQWGVSACNVSLFLQENPAIPPPRGRKAAVSALSRRPKGERRDGPRQSGASRPGFRASHAVGWSRPCALMGAESRVNPRSFCARPHQESVCVITAPPQSLPPGWPPDGPNAWRRRRSKRGRSDASGARLRSRLRGGRILDIDDSAAN